jgi:hypothetical protein
VPTVAGLLILGREAALREHLPTHEVAFQVLDGTHVRVNDFYRTPLLSETTFGPEKRSIGNSGTPACRQPGKADLLSRRRYRRVTASDDGSFSEADDEESGRG